MKQQEEKYTPTKLNSDKKAVLSLQIKRKDKSTVFFPYSLTAIIESENIGDNQYSMVLLGGGKTVILYLKNFDDETYTTFCDEFAEHKIKYIFELPKNSKNADYPHFLVEVESLIRR